MILNKILHNSNYKLTQFQQEHIERLEASITAKAAKSGKAFYAQCLIRHKEIKLTPEEVVRQLFIMQLLEKYKYPENRIELEYAVAFGREKKRADIVIFDREWLQFLTLSWKLKNPGTRKAKSS